MADLIDRDALLADIAATVVFSGRTAINAGIHGANKIIDRIKAAPTVEAVEVVRCRDCKHYDGKWLCKISGVPSRKPCDFCSHGERKDGDVDG